MAKVWGWYGTRVTDHSDHYSDQDESVAPAVQVDFALAVGPGRLNVSVVVPGGSVTLTQILPALQSFSGNIMASAMDRITTEGQKISCRAGCGACCRQMVPLSLFEAEALGDWIRTLPQERQDELARRFDAALAALRDGGVLERMEMDTLGDVSEEMTMLGLDYLTQRVACPFLEDESCSIHPIRPLICREYLVTSPAEFCVYPTRDKVVGVPVPVKLSRVMFKLGAEMEGEARGWIPLVFLFAWMKAGAKPENAIRGEGPAVLYEVVKRLAAK
jgi:Fe-S-cluster containining protein